MHRDSPRILHSRLIPFLLLLVALALPSLTPQQMLEASQKADTHPSKQGRQ